MKDMKQIRRLNSLLKYLISIKLAMILVKKLLFNMISLFKIFKDSLKRKLLDKIKNYRSFKLSLKNKIKKFHLFQYKDSILNIPMMMGLGKNCWKIRFNHHRSNQIWKWMGYMKRLMKRMGIKMDLKCPILILFKVAMKEVVVIRLTEKNFH